MKMTFRWYGDDSDSVTLKQIKQIPGMSGIMGLLDYKAAGEVWNEEEIRTYIEKVHAAGLECEVIESVNVHEDIKLGLPSRDLYIENYRITIRNLAKYGVKVIICQFYACAGLAAHGSCCARFPKMGPTVFILTKKSWGT